MTIWDTEPFLIEYQQRNPPPLPPARSCVRRFPFKPTKAYSAYLDQMSKWTNEALRCYHVYLRQRYDTS